jgi:hypothetical protein
MPASDESKSHWDLFIAHASEDKDDFVRPLAETLERLGVEVWYDEFQLRPGDSLVDTIDRGLANSTYGLLVISPAFLQKPWPGYERRGLTTRELAGNSVMIPVWRGVTQAAVADFSPTLADKFALPGDDVGELAIAVLGRVRPDLAQQLARLRARERLLARRPIRSIPFENLSEDGPVRRQKLPAALLQRILLIQEATVDILPISFEETVLGFKKDLSPEEEAGIWEILLAVYLYVIREDGIPAEGRNEVMTLALNSSLRRLTKEDGEELEYTTVERVQAVKDLMMKRIHEHAPDKLEGTRAPSERPLTAVRRNPGASDS